MDSFYFFEEELLTKMHNSFVNRFNLDAGTAAELAVEVFEIISIVNPKLIDFDSVQYH
jgi:hypothetical protein